MYKKNYHIKNVPFQLGQIIIRYCKSYIKCSINFIPCMFECVRVCVAGGGGGGVGGGWLKRGSVYLLFSETGCFSAF